ncbi:MAG: metal ABC transporter permease [Solirubrobacteraceae bacterium]|jgi:zinc/manganese transport system permease protein
MRLLFEPGFFSSQPVHTALVIGGVVAVVSAVVGVFTVLRGQSFAGHALTDVSMAGGSAAFLLGISPLLGFVGMGLIGAGSIDAIGTQRVKGRDLATGIVLGAATGLAALLLYYDTTNSTTTGATQTILFGSIFTIAPSTVPLVVAFSVIAVAVIAVLYRPLLLASTSPELAAARGVPVRLIGLGFMAALAVAVGLSAIAIGAILSTALLIGPAATALRLTNRTGAALIIAAVIGVVATWLGVLLAYDSYYWGTGHNGYPVSFFIVALSFLAYLASGLPFVRTLTSRRATPTAAIAVVKR